MICGKVKAVHCFVNLKKLISCSTGDYTYNHSMQEAEQEDQECKVSLGYGRLKIKSNCSVSTHHVQVTEC